MQQVGHADPKVTLSIYARVMYGGEGERDRLNLLTAETPPLRRHRPKIESPSRRIANSRSTSPEAMIVAT
jgi:hypothetical protein